MRPEKIIDAVGNIDTEMISAADKARKNNNTRIWKIAASAAACIAVVIGAVWLVSPASPLDKTTNDGNTIKFDSPLAVTEVNYPTCAPFPNFNDYENLNGDANIEAYNAAFDLWISDLNKRSSYAINSKLDLTDFYSATVPQMLASEQNENRVYSPLNVYFALAMLSEVTDGNSRQQILDLLGTDSVTTLRENISDLWRANYVLDGRTTSVLANSIWLNNAIKYNPETLEQLAENHYATSFSGEMGSDKLNNALRDWINAHTGDMLTEQTESITLSPQTVMALVSCIDFRANWQDSFGEKNNTEAVFHALDGDITCEFMNQIALKPCYGGENFVAVSQTLADSGEMWFILPDEGYSIEDVTANPELISLLANPSSVNIQSLLVTLSVPKFDVSSGINLTDPLKSLGITDVFDSAVADFTPLTQEESSITLSQAQHSARVTIDENGCTAAAFTILAAEGGAFIDVDEIEFTLDRPFIFAITSLDNSILFIGTVNSPIQ